MNAKGPRYVVVLTPAHGVDDGVKRLRHLLKVASGSFGLVVISCREEEAEPASPLTEGLNADQLVKQLGLRWPDIIAVERAPTTVAADGGEISWRAMLRVCHDCSDELSVKERGFIDTLSRWRGAPTPKQIKWLTGIYERLWGRPD